MTTGTTNDTLRALLDHDVAAGVVPGAVALIGGRDARSVAVGALAVGGPPMPTDAIARIQSMTKAVTAVATLRLVAAGALDLDDSVERWLPELAARRVLRRPNAELDDTVPAVRPITVRHLLTCTSGYGMHFAPTPMGAAMEANQTAAGPEPVALGADPWLARLAELPLTFQPGDGWRYHHSFAVLGILLSRVVGRPLGDHLAADVFGPLGMVDSGFWVPADRLDRLPAAYRDENGRLVEVEPAGGGFYAGPPPYDVSHSELVSTAADYHRFMIMLADGGRLDGEPFVTAEHLALMTSDQVPAHAKTDDSFFPGFWDETGWGFGVGTAVAGEHTGRYGWSGGQGTHFFVDPDGTVGLLLTQVEIGERVMALVGKLDALPIG